MSRLTTFDAVRNVYVIDPDASGNHIQKLGELEDRDEKKEVIVRRTDGGGGHLIACPSCNGKLPSEVLESSFCPYCGQRLTWGWI